LVSLLFPAFERDDRLSTLDISHNGGQFWLCQSFATNALKHLMDQLEERILQTDQLKNASKFATSR